MQKNHLPLIRNRADACSILGVPADASDTDIKKAYKSLVKLFHPDMGSVEDNDVYTRVVEAYEFLCAHPAPAVQTHGPETTQKTPPPAPQARPSATGGKILGSPDKIYRSGSNREDFEKKYREQRAQKALQWEQQMDAYAAEQKRREDEYRRTIAAIRAIQVAEAIKAIVKDSE